MERLPVVYALGKNMGISDEEIGDMYVLLSNILYELMEKDGIEEDFLLGIIELMTQSERIQFLKGVVYAARLIEKYGIPSKG